MAKGKVNNMHKRDLEDGLGFVLGDPELSEQQRRCLYEVGCRLYGELEGGLRV